MAKEKTAVAEKKGYTTNLSTWSNTITNLVADDYSTCGVMFDEYSASCAMEAITSIYNLAKTNNYSLKNFDNSNIRSVVGRCASLKLNANAYPRECYFQIRKVNVGGEWTPAIEMGIEGAGNDALLRNFGVDVDKVYPYWVVKEGDDYTPPRRKGIETTPPEWTENGLSQKAIRVVYPVKLTDGTVIYLISERESVKVNLFAHIRNNLMNETFGICKSRHNATDKQKEEIETKKQEIFDALRGCETLDDMLACEIAQKYISAAWLDTPESMIVRKMCNNAIRKYPKNFDAMANRAYVEMDETYAQSQEEIIENENSVEFVEPDEIIDGEVIE